MKTLGKQGFSSLVGSSQETRFPPDSRSVCQKFARKFGPLLNAATRRPRDVRTGRNAPS